MRGRAGGCRCKKRKTFEENCAATAKETAENGKNAARRTPLKPPETGKIYGLAEVSEKSKARQADAKNAKRSKKIAPRPQKKLLKMEKCGAQNAAKPPETGKIYGLAEVSERRVRGRMMRKEAQQKRLDASS